MTAETDEAVKRRGRRPATDSTDTWCTILDVSRRLFAERGYSAVTNKDLAAAAGVTTSALYHYVESKLDLYVAVYRDVMRRIGRRFNDALASSDTFVGKVQAVLEASSAMNGSDPTFAQFTGVVRTDMRRFPEIAERLAPGMAQTQRFFVDLVETGIATGEIDAADRDAATAFVSLVLIGLTDGETTDQRGNRCAIDGVMLVLRGALVHPIPGG
jgi:AcrR family transcriptional regulator